MYLLITDSEWLELITTDYSELIDDCITTDTASSDPVELEFN